MANNYNPYNQNYYVQDLQGMRDRIDRTLQTYQNNQFANQQQQPQIQQTFQLAPNQNNNAIDGAMAQNEEEVKRFLVLKPTLFVNNDFSTLWIKDVNGSIRTFKTEEIIQVDESVEEITKLKKELADVKALLLEQVQRNLPENQEEVKEEKKTSKK